MILILRDKRYNYPFDTLTEFTKIHKVLITIDTTDNRIRLQ